MAKSDGSMWLWLGIGGAVAAYFISQQSSASGASAAGTPFYSTVATPLSIYPEYAYTAQTSMASTPSQKASTVTQPTTYFTSVQQQEQAALLTQCQGAYPGCTPMLGDTQLGF